MVIKRMAAKKPHIVKARLGADGKLRRIGAAGKTGCVLRGRAEVARLDSPAAFAPDDDTPLFERRELRELKPVAKNATGISE